MKNNKGHILTDKNDILEETVNHYEKVFKNRTIKEGLEQHKNEREQLAKLRLEQAAMNKTPDWDLADLTEAIKSLKKITNPVMLLGS